MDGPKPGCSGISCCCLPGCYSQKLESKKAYVVVKISVTRSLTHSLTPRCNNPCRVLADSSSRLQPSLSLALLLQLLIPSLSVSLITPSIHLRFGLPTRHLPSGLSKVIFLHGRLACIRTICPAHLSLDILIKMSVTEPRKMRTMAPEHCSC
jgi:hypothetical protein